MVRGRMLIILMITSINFLSNVRWIKYFYTCMENWETKKNAKGIIRNRILWPYTQWSVRKRKSESTFRFCIVLEVHGIRTICDDMTNLNMCIIRSINLSSAMRMKHNKSEGATTDCCTDAPKSYSQMNKIHSYKKKK